MIIRYVGGAAGREPPGQGTRIADPRRLDALREAGARIAGAAAAIEAVQRNQVARITDAPMRDAVESWRRGLAS